MCGKAMPFRQCRYSWGALPQTGAQPQRSAKTSLPGRPKAFRTSSGKAAQPHARSLQTDCPASALSNASMVELQSPKINSKENEHGETHSECSLGRHTQRRQGPDEV